MVGRLKRLKKLKKSTIDEKPVLDHLDDLRSVLIKIVVCLLFFMMLCLFFRNSIFEILRYPLKMANIPNESLATISLRPMDPISLTFKTSFYCSIVLSLPFTFAFLCGFVMPGLKNKEKKVFYLSVSLGTVLFLIGALFCYFFVLPRTLEFFYNDSIRIGIQPSWTAINYYSMVSMLTIIFGFGFELPVVVMLLMKLELIELETMKKSRSIAWVSIFIVSAVITLTTDILTLCLLALPLMILYEICIWIAVLTNKD